MSRRYPAENSRSSVGADHANLPNPPHLDKRAAHHGVQASRAFRPPSQASRPALQGKLPALTAGAVTRIVAAPLSRRVCRWTRDGFGSGVNFFKTLRTPASVSRSTGSGPSRWFAEQPACVPMTAPLAPASAQTITVVLVDTGSPQRDLQERSLGQLSSVGIWSMLILRSRIPCAVDRRVTSWRRA